MSYCVYVLVNACGGTYVGQTSDLARRLAQHNDPANHLSMHTKRRPGPWILLHVESFSTRADAMRREKELKSGKGRDFISHLKAGGC